MFYIQVYKKFDEVELVDLVSRSSFERVRRKPNSNAKRSSTQFETCSLMSAPLFTGGSNTERSNLNLFSLPFEFLRPAINRAKLVLFMLNEFLLLIFFAS